MFVFLKDADLDKLKKGFIDRVLIPFLREKYPTDRPVCARFSPCVPWSRDEVTQLLEGEEKRTSEAREIILSILVDLQDHIAGNRSNLWVNVLNSLVSEGKARAS